MLPTENRRQLTLQNRISGLALSPDEKRVETFTFPVKAGVQAQVQATFWYYYSPLATTEAQKQLTFLTLRRLVP